MAAANAAISSPRRSLSLTLPWPSAKLSPNERTHWAVKARAAKNYRRTCSWIALSSGGLHAEIPAAGDIKVRLIFAPPSRQPRDRDNLLARMKSGLDGIADGLRVNDSRFRPAVEIGQPKKGGEVIAMLSWL